MKNMESGPIDQKLFENSPSGLKFDAKNLFTGQYFKLDNAIRTGNFDKLKPIKTYEEYVNERYSPEMAKKILNQSNQENVKKINELVVEYNAALPQIQSEKNVQLGKEILDRLNGVFGE